MGNEWAKFLNLPSTPYDKSSKVAEIDGGTFKPKRKRPVKCEHAERCELRKRGKCDELNCNIAAEKASSAGSARKPRKDQESLAEGAEIAEEKGPEVCDCAAFTKGTEPGTDWEGYGRCIDVCEGQWQIGLHVAKITYCPWCGRKVRPVE